ncbi:MAG TPA: hypothetical protein VHE35_03225 [Kofleriaceae bacterium]|nr:hypothetical protein [Kofleriaceae bacterium]
MRPLHHLRAALPGLLALACAPLAACTDEPPAGPPDVTTGAYHTYAQTGWILPHNASEARTVGADLDGDGVIDNQAGSLIGSLIGLGLDLDGASAAAFSDGDVVALHRVRADSLVTDGSIEWTTYDGQPTAAPPRFDGTDHLDVLARTGRLIGLVRDGRAELDWGDATISMPFFPDQSPLRLPLTGARMTMYVDGAGCAARIVGAIPEVEIDGLVLPDLAMELIIHIARHPDHPFTPIAMQVFDTNKDGKLTVDEVLATPVARGLFSPDLDTDGDGVDDAMSFGASFECVPATFTPPEP